MTKKSLLEWLDFELRCALEDHSSPEESQAFYMGMARMAYMVIQKIEGKDV